MGATNKVKKRPLFSKLVNDWTGKDIVLLLAGTGLRLRKVMKLLTLSTHKLESDLNEFVIVDFGLYENVDDISAYLQQFFPIPNIPERVLSNTLGTFPLITHSSSNPIIFTGRVVTQHFMQHTL